MGDSARAVGDVALNARDRAVEIDEKHNVVERCKEATGQAWEKAKEMDQKHNILVKTKDFFTWCAASVADFCQRHKVVEKSVDTASRCASWASEQIQNAANENGRASVSSTTTQAI